MNEYTSKATSKTLTLPTLTFDVDLSIPDTYYVNAASKGQTGRSVNGVRVTSVMRIGAVIIGKVNSAIYVNEAEGGSPVPKISFPSAKTLGLSVESKTIFVEAVNAAWESWSLRDRAYQAAVVELTTPTGKRASKASTTLSIPESEQSKPDAATTATK
jgi:hypothetical protein